LDVRYDMAAALKESGQRLSATFALMPVRREDALGIGTTPTPLLPSVSIGRKLGLRSLWFKCESANPSGSFKDRPVAIAVAKAKAFGFKQVVVASSGNGAAASAACAARHGLRSILIVPATTPVEKVAQSLFYGARVYKVDGPYSNCYKLALELAAQHPAYNVTTTFINPYALEGDKQVGYELFETLGHLPDSVYVPVGAGPLLVGTLKGLEEYREMRGLQQSTRMVAVQAQGNCPIVKAYEQGLERVECEFSPQTVAGGIADGLVGYEQDGAYTLKACLKTGGAARAVSDEDILWAQRLLATEEGLFVEPSAAAALAAIAQDARCGRLKETDTIVALLTGHGLKDMKSIGTSGCVRSVNSVEDIASELYSK
jgi:threonine synthase